MAIIFTHEFPVGKTYVPVFDGYVYINNGAASGRTEQLIADASEAIGAGSDKLVSIIERELRGITEFKYAFRVEHYDYFGSHKTHYETFANPSDCIKAWRKEKSFEYNYDDSWTKIGNPFPIKGKVAGVERQRFHARSKEEWDKKNQEFEFSDAELDFLMGLFDSKDEEIMI